MHNTWTLEQTTLLKERLEYNPETGEFKRKAFKGCIQKYIGVAVSPNYDKDGYKRITINGITYKAHRVAFFLYHGRQATSQIDHFDQDKGNNAISNLRELSHQANQYNKQANKNSKTGLPGVSVGKLLVNGDVLYEVRVGSGSRQNSSPGGQYIGSTTCLEDAKLLRERALLLRLKRKDLALTKEEILELRNSLPN